MGSLLRILPMLGTVLSMFSLTMAVPLAFAYFGGDGAVTAHATSLAITLGSGAMLWLAGRRYRDELQPRDGFVLVTLVWGGLPVFGALPLLLQVPGLSFTDAYFEAMSGLTTTGATVLTDLERLPLSTNVWRGLMSFMGGMGIIVLAVAILPLLGVGGTQLFRAETPGPMKDTKLTPRIAETARGLWTVYFGISLACMLAYRIAGMGWADAFMHMCTTVSLGGFSSYDASFAAFDSPAIEAVGTVFMAVAGINFALYFLVWRRRSVSMLWRDTEARVYLLLLSAAVFLVALVLTGSGSYPTFVEALRHASFNVVSVATTTGYASVDYAAWPLFAPGLMLLLSAFLSCAGSTGGGIKLTRGILLYRQGRRELTRIVHPRATVPVTMAGGVVPSQVMLSVLAFMLFYGAITIVATLALLASGMDPLSAFTAVLASINNLGPGLGAVGPASNFQALTDFQTWVCTVTMLLGRLELLSVLVLLTPQFWKQ
jgi:trk system potassium uptake protein TrkH